MIGKIWFRFTVPDESGIRRRWTVRIAHPCDMPSQPLLATSQGLCCWAEREIWINQTCTAREKHEAVMHELMHAFWGKSVRASAQERALQVLDSRCFFDLLLDRFALSLPPIGGAQ